MIEEAFGYKIPREALGEILPDYHKIDEKLIDYRGTNIRSANLLLADIMSEREKECLEKAFFGDNGWYHTINGDGMIKIKLAAMSLGITNTVFTFNKDAERKILDQISQESIEEQILMMRCYIKQKAVTYVTMCNYLRNIKKKNQMSIMLYRGINIPYQHQKYLFSGMESWTTDINTAFRFARNEGYVIEREYPISQIFAGMRSTFKNSPGRLCRYNGFYVRREREMIVENFDNVLDCIDGKGILLAVDKNIY